MASIKDLRRMCESMTCKDCPFSDCHVFDLLNSYPGKDIDAMVDKWVSDHPIKTYAMDFFEKFPNAPKDSNGTPIACWKHIYGDENDCGSGGCIECWNQEIKTEKEKQ